MRSEDFLAQERGSRALLRAAIMAARIAGEEPIIAVDMKRKRLELALELGATEVILNRGADLPSRIARIPFDRLIRFYAFAAINEAKEDSRKVRTVKPVLRMDHAPAPRIL